MSMRYERYSELRPGDVYVNESRPDGVGFLVIATTKSHGETSITWFHIFGMKMHKLEIFTISYTDDSLLPVDVTFWRASDDDEVQ